MRNLAESLLAVLTSRDRAAAIYGDLTELAATRGRLWFWTAYSRTILSIGWRTAPAAFLLGFAGMALIFDPVIRWWVYRTGLTGMDQGFFGSNHLRLISWNFARLMAQFLTFALPFVLVRFGLRNRLTQLTCALFLFALPVYSFRAWAMDLSSLLIVVASAAALALPHLRRPMLVLAGMGVTAVAWKLPYLVGLARVYRRHLPIFSNSQLVLCNAIAFAIAAMVCSHLYRRLLPQQPVIE
jgi:hypothetical protein